MPLMEDTMLEERYRIDGPLAFGGMGAVYRAFDTNLQIDVAVKENYFSTPQAIEQFKREALILARLRHPGLPRVLQHFSNEGQQYLVMEFIPGDNLWEMIKSQGGPFPETQAIAWINKICEAVTYLHNQTPPIIHRDIKPQNIKVMPNNQVVLVDFGVAKEGSVGARTATGARGVTPGFSPPEQYSGGSSCPASDVYALGATLYALLTAVKPPDSISLVIGEVEYIPPDQYNPNIDFDVVKAITWAMQPKPNDRPQMVEEWRQKLIDVNFNAPPEKEVLEPLQEESIIKTPLEEKAADVSYSEVEDQKLQSESNTCPSCKSQNRPDIRFCEICGESLTAVKLICSSCGAQNRPEVCFCEDCGEALK